MDLTCELERMLHRRAGGNVVLGVQCSHGTGEGGERPALSIAAAIDRSSSMKGAKLKEVKEATAALVEALGPRDRLALVAFDAGVEVLAAGPVVDKKQFLAPLERLECRVGTNISMALETAGNYLEEDKSGNVKRVLLLTDGAASQGDTSPGSLGQLAGALLLEGVATTCLGFGLNYDSTTLVAIAQAGAGRVHHVSDSARSKLAAIYGGELDRMRALAAPRLRVQVQPAEGARVHGSRNTYPMKRVGTGFELELADLRENEARWVLFDLQVPPCPPGAEEAPLAHVTLQWEDTRNESHEVKQTVLVRYADDATVERAEANGAVIVQMALLDAAAAKARALADAEHGDVQEGSFRLKNTMLRIKGETSRYMNPRVEQEIERLAGLSNMLQDGKLDEEEKKRVAVEVHDGRTPTFRVDLGDAPPL